MKKYITPLIIILSLASCIPPGKLSESLEANTKLNSKYDSIQHKLNDTLSTFSASLSSLKGNINNLKDSVSYYRGLMATRPSQSQGDMFLNQILDYSLLSKSDLVGILNKGFVFVDIPSNIMFATGSASLSKKSIEMLGGIARLLEAQPNLNFLIEGHTDNKAFKENNTNNWNLSVNRAAAVARILQTKYKIDPKRMIAAGRSEYLPMDNNNTKLGRSNNRRIRIVLMPSMRQLMNLSN
jgi:chemotaxis protein MotB